MVLLNITLNSRQVEWEHFINPLDDNLWGQNSDVNWMQGSWVKTLDHPKQLTDSNPWIPLDPGKAEGMIRRDSQTVLEIIGALFSWRVCAISQLQAGLAPHGAPDFDRTQPNLYGALLRLGIINVGFSKREAFGLTQVPEVWASMGGSLKFTKHLTDILNMPAWTRSLITNGRFGGVKIHARHNTLTAHVGLTFSKDERVRFVSGDGWGRFRDLDPQAIAEIGGMGINSADAIAFMKNGATVALETQIHANDLKKKLEAWCRFLVYSPMSRRGLLCVWLQAPSAQGCSYGNFLSVFEPARDMQGMTAGNPTVASRMGLARWNEWYDEKGLPTERFGEYMDMFGNRQSIYDPKWMQYAPPQQPFINVNEWGWRLMEDQIRREWNWDVTRWVKPDAMRGGFFGFIGSEIREEERKRG